MILESWYEQDKNMTVVPKEISGRLYSSDSNANRIGVKMLNGKDPAAIASGAVCTGKIYRSDGYTVAVAGAIDGNKAYFDVPATGYAVPGRVVITIVITEGSDDATVLCVKGTVVRTSDAAYIDPDAVDYADVLTLLAQMASSKTACDTAAGNANGAISYIASTEASSTASAAHPAGTYFVYNGTLYRATADIASGGAIVTTGTGKNCAAVMVGREISEVKNAIYNDGNIVKSITGADIESGGWNYSAKYATATRLRSKELIEVKKGTIIKYSSETQDVFFGVLETKTSNTYLQSGWNLKGQINAEYIVPYDGWLTIVVRDGTDASTALDVDDYDITIDILFPSTRAEINSLVSATKAELHAEIAFVSGKTALNFMQKVIGSQGTYSDSAIRCATPPFTLENGVYVVQSIDPNIRVMLYTDALYGGAFDGFIFNGVSGNSYAVSVKKFDDSPITPEEAQAKVYIEKLTLSEPENDPGMEGVTFRSLADEKAYHAKIFDNVMIQTKIWKMPKSGINLQRIQPIAPSATSDEDHPVAPNLSYISCLFFRLDENGNLVGANDYTHGNIIWSDGQNPQPTMMLTRASIYYPYEDNLYFAVYYHTTPNFASAGFNVYMAYGNVKNGHGRLTNLAPATIVGGLWPYPHDRYPQKRTDAHPTFRQWNSTGYATQQYYYGSVIRLQDAREICCSAKYSMACWVYDNDGYMLGIIRGSFLSDNKYTGVNYIDLSAYGTEGYCFVVIRAPFTAKQPVSGQTITQLDEVTMGGLHLYNDVMDNVFVRYYNHVYIDHGEALDPKVAHNIELLKRLNLGNSLPFTYRGPVSGGDGLKMEAMKNVSPYFYAASSIYNQLFINVSLKSYVTALQNPNSQIYLVGQAGISAETTRGFGSTCSGLPPILSGFNWAAAHTFIPGSDPENNPDFEYVSRWKYTEEPEALKVGDWLIGLTLRDTDASVAPTNIDRHAVLITGKIHINGELVCYEGIEAYPPYVKYRYIYVASPLNRYNMEFSANEPLGDYFTRYIRLNDHSKIKTFEDAYGSMATNYTAGKLMCDRGTDSVYGEGQDHCYITIADESVQEFKIYKDNVYITTIDLTSPDVTRKTFYDQTFGQTQYTAVDIADIIHTNGEGYYKLTVTVDGSEKTEETFAVGGLRTVDVEIPDPEDPEDSEATGTITFADLSHAEYVVAVYYCSENTKTVFYTYTLDMISGTSGEDQAYITVPMQNTWYTDGTYKLWTAWVVYSVWHDGVRLGTYYVKRHFRRTGAPYYVSSNENEGQALSAPVVAEGSGT